MKEIKRSERMELICKNWREATVNPPESRYLIDLHGAALGKYAHLPTRERIARSSADAIVAQPIYINTCDRTIKWNITNS